MRKIEIDSLNEPVENPQVKPAPKIHKPAKTPAALKPSLDWEGLDAEITSEIYEGPNPDWNEILKSWGYDPEVYEVSEPIKVSSWEIMQEGEVKTLYSYKAGVRTKQNTRHLDYGDLVREIKKHRKMTKAPGGESAFLVCLSDWQIAKADGDGTVGTVKRILRMIDDVEGRIRELRKIGRKIGTLYVAGVGDIIEGCDGNYGTQTFSTEMNRREQVRVARRLIRDAICRWAKLFNEVIVVAVPGNHGEHRKEGRLFTNTGDNDDVAVFEMVAEILSANPEAYGHVKFYVPENETNLVIDIAGTRVGFAHGHITSKSGTPQQKIKNWWQDQAFCNTSIGSAKILITGHYHHFSIVEYDNDKIHVQCPSMDGGSEWWVDLTGQNSRPGTLTMVITKRGYQDLEII